MSTNPLGAAPVASGSNVGSGSPGLQKMSALPPRTIDVEKLSSVSLSVESLLADAEDASIILGRREAERAALYDGDGDDLRTKYGVQR